MQIAKSFGAEVTAVCSTKNIALVKLICADHAIDYTRIDFTTGTQHYDLILDIVATHSLLECRRVLTPAGTYVMVGMVDPGTLPNSVLSCSPETLHGDREELQAEPGGGSAALPGERTCSRQGRVDRRVNGDRSVMPAAVCCLSYLPPEWPPSVAGNSDAFSSAQISAGTHGGFACVARLHQR